MKDLNSTQLRKNVHAAALRVSKVFQGSAALDAAHSIESRCDSRGANEVGADSLTPVDERIQQLSAELGEAFGFMGQYEDELVTARRELNAKDAELASLRAELAEAKERMGVATTNTITTPSNKLDKDITQRQREVIATLDSLVQEGNSCFIKIFETLEPIQQLLQDGHSLIINKNTSQGDNILNLLEPLMTYMENYQLSLVKVNGKLVTE
ncbi:hypothetical protein [Pseudoalteromonas umbrosa]|uniref:hypothetical protein n=1 Tax=Pseudoalteromonas umbrosa TaxID=3048489 RepID=UPI0024C42843|nr:hypothetical protein [Pseudoalteromonas sp. B95]MDK1290103.1 hypothetical protein [Pseudoalteromonas sp. B95]